MVFTLNCAPIGTQSLEQRKLNTHYPKQFTVSSPEQLEQIVQNYDTCMNKADRGSGSRFTGSTLLYLDVDEGLSLEDAIKRIEGFGVEGYAWTSKNHGKEKNGKTNDRFHIFFPIPLIQEEETYKSYLQTLLTVFPEADRQTDVSRYYFGYEGSKVYYIAGKPITEYLDTVQMPRQSKTPQEETIFCGVRNATLFEKALKCLKLDWNDKEIYEYISFLNQTTCEEPLPNKELENIVKQVGHYQCKYDLSQLAFNQLPKTFLQREDNQGFLYNSMNDDLLYYEMGLYKPDYGLTRLHNGYVKFFDELLEESKRLSSKSPHYKRLEKLGMEGQKDLPAIKNNTKKLCKVVDDGDFNTERHLLNLKNGVFNLQTGELLDFNPKYYFTFQMNASYNPEATCPLWLSFLDETFEGNQALIRFIQKSIGYTLSGLTSEKKVWICHGKGDTGKTTFIETLQYLMGDFSRTISPKTLDKSTTNSWELAEIIGKRLLTISETDENFVFSNTVKALSGNSTTLSVEAKYKKPLEIAPFVKIWLDTNNKPVLSNGDRGSFLKRLTFVPFLHIVQEEKKDEQLSSKLRGEIDGILNWALEGWNLYTREGLGTPEIVEEYKNGYKEETNDIADFITTYYDLTYNKEDRTLRQTIIDDYEEYSKFHSSFPKITIKALFQRIEEYYPDIEATTTKNHGKKTYLGIKRLPNPFSYKEKVLEDLNI